VEVDASAALHLCCKASSGDHGRDYDYAMFLSAADDETVAVEVDDFHEETAAQNCPVRGKRSRQACTNRLLLKDVGCDLRQIDTCLDDLQIATRERSDP